MPVPAIADLDVAGKRLVVRADLNVPMKDGVVTDATRITRFADGMKPLLAKGARLAIYDENGMRAATPFIGRPHRWLAPLGVADLDGDGRVEIAYVDRPHLAKVLRIWRYEGGRLRHLADVPGLTNHRIGWDRIPGGIRDCGRGPEMITADGGWRRVIATTWDGRRAAKRDLGAYAGEQSLARAMACKE